MTRKSDNWASQLAAEIAEAVNAAKDATKASETTAAAGNELEAALYNQTAQKHRDRAHEKKILLWNHMTSDITKLTHRYSGNLDLMGEVYEKFLTVMDRYDANYQGEVWSFVGRSLQNFLRDLYRKAMREKANLQSESLEQVEEQLGQVMVARFQRKQRLIEQRFDLRECEVESLRAIWSGDPDRARKITALLLNAKLEGDGPGRKKQTQHKLAQRYGVSTPTVNRWIKAGKAQLQREMEKRCPEFISGRQESPD